jgi:hypothetical protein
MTLAQPQYFFARPGKAVHHVGFVSEAGMLHASETGGFLEDRRSPPTASTTSSPPSASDAMTAASV